MKWQDGCSREDTVGVHVRTGVHTEGNNADSLKNATVHRELRGAQGAPRLGGGEEALDDDRD